MLKSVKVVTELINSEIRKQLNTYKNEVVYCSGSVELQCCHVANK